MVPKKNKCPLCCWEGSSRSPAAGANYHRKELFSHALEYECRDGLSLLVRYKMDVNVTKWGKTPLLVSMKMGYFDVAEELIRSGAKVNRRGPNSRTPLCWAVYYDAEDMVALLLENGAGCTVNSAFLEAIRCKNLRIVKFLRERGARVKIPEIEEYRPLVLAARQRSCEIVEYLVKEGGDVNERDEGGRTPLILAIENESLEIVELLVDNGGDVDKCDGEGRIPLILAVEIGNLEIVKCLVDEGADVNVKSEETTPLILAVEKLLVNSDEDDEGRRSLLSLVMKCGRLEIVKCLLKAGADVYGTDKKGKSSLIVAAEHDNFEIFDLLVKVGGAEKATLEEIRKISKVNLDFAINLLNEKEI